MDDGSGPIQVVQILLPIAWEPLWCNTNDRVLIGVIWIIGLPLDEERKVMKL